MFPGSRVPKLFKRERIEGGELISDDAVRHVVIKLEAFLSWSWYRVIITLCHQWRPPPPPTHTHAPPPPPQHTYPILTIPDNYQRLLDNIMELKIRTFQATCFVKSKGDSTWLLLYLRFAWRHLWFDFEHWYIWCQHIKRVKGQYKNRMWSFHKSISIASL